MTGVDYPNIIRPKHAQPLDNITVMSTRGSDDDLVAAARDRRVHRVPAFGRREAHRPRREGRQKCRRRLDIEAQIVPRQAARRIRNVAIEREPVAGSEAAVFARRVARVIGCDRRA